MTESITHRHEDRVSYRLSALGAETRLRLASQLAPMGIHPQHFGVLRHIAAECGSTQQDVADAMRLRRSVMVGLVDDLEAAGLVERRRHPSDRRANALHPTAAARRTLLRAQRASAQLDHELLAPLNALEQEQFVAMLGRVVDGAGLSDGIYPPDPQDRAASPPLSTHLPETPPATSTRRKLP